MRFVKEKECKIENLKYSCILLSPLIVGMLMYRSIKSFVYRGGRISNRQKRALESSLQKYLLPESERYWEMDEYFSSSNDLVVEIGFGMGNSLVETALKYPHVNFIGIEVFPPGIGNLVASIEEHQINNIRIATFDAKDVFKKNISPQSLSGIQIFFPDPWPKKRHHKRRLVQAGFIKEILPSLKPQGFIHCATDWEEYALDMKHIFKNEELLRPRNENDKQIIVRPKTKFEQRGLKLGHKITDLIFIKNL